MWYAWYGVLARGRDNTAMAVTFHMKTTTKEDPPTRVSTNTTPSCAFKPCFSVAKDMKLQAMPPAVVTTSAYGHDTLASERVREQQSHLESCSNASRRS